jgi:uncharacterized protein (DUF433 family)
MSEEIVYGHITQTPGVCGGEACIAGHRIRVHDIALDHEWSGLCPEEICVQYPGLTLGQVHAALAYFFDHRDAILAEIEADEKYVEEFMRQHPDGMLRG